MVESLTIADSIYRQMRKSIISGELAPGTRLVQRQLAAQYGASSIPVLEAIRRLESDGLVESNPGLGARVRTWDTDDLLGVCLFREILEGAACRLFAVNASPVEKLTLIEYQKRFDVLVEDGDVEGVVQTDLALHLHIVRCSKSSVLVRYAENSSVLSTTIQNAFYDSGRYEPSVLGPKGIHDDLIAALSESDPDRAEQAGRAHVQIAMKSWDEQLRARTRV